MTQDYLNHLFENYTAVDAANIYWTTDGTAFKSPEDAKAYAKRLPDAAVKFVPHGGTLAQAVDLDTADSPLGVTEGKYLDDTQTAGAAAPIDYTKMNVQALKALCAERGIEVPGGAKKAEIISLLVAADVAAGNAVVDPAEVDYTTLDKAQLQALCTEREIAFTEEEDEAALIMKLTADDAGNEPGE